MAIKLTYFDIEGAAEPVRLALVLSGVEFEDNRVKMEEWAALKPTTKFGQLPEMKIGDKTVAQSGAMLRYVGKSYGGGALYPQEGEEMLKVEETMGLIEDMAREWGPSLYISMRPQKFGYDSDFAKTDAGKAKVKQLREAFVQNSLPTFAKHFSSMIEANGGFLCANKPTVADCFLLPNLRKFQKGFIDHVPTTCLDEYPVLTAYIKRMMDIPEVAKWYSK